MAAEGTAAIVAAILAGSVALLGFGLDSAIEGLASVIVVWRFTDGRKRPGLITGTFCMGYAVARIVGEIFREPDSFLGFILGSDWLTMGMLLSLPVLAFGAWLVIRAYRNPPLTGARAP